MCSVALAHRLYSFSYSTRPSTFTSKFAALNGLSGIREAATIHALLNAVGKRTHSRSKCATARAPPGEAEEGAARSCAPRAGLRRNAPLQPACTLTYVFAFVFFHCVCCAARAGRRRKIPLQPAFTLTCVFVLCFCTFRVCVSCRWNKKRAQLCTEGGTQAKCYFAACAHAD